MKKLSGFLLVLAFAGSLVMSGCIAAALVGGGVAGYAVAKNVEIKKIDEKKKR
jgi:hypothetical protein